MKRDALFDNAKFILIFLVVFGHMIQPFTDGSKPMYTLYMWIYTFHMPAFILLAGFFAKGAGNKGYIAKLAKKLLFPYLIFQTIYTGYFFFIGKESWATGLFYPHWSLWFLVSMFCWHLLLQLFSRIPPLAGMAITVSIGVLVGYFDTIGHAYSLSRTFVFFPFFLAGYWLSKENIAQWRTVPVRIVSLAVMAVVAGLLITLPEINSGWLLGSKSYAVLNMENWGGLIRLGTYMLAGLMIVSVIAWMPGREIRWTSLGQRTLYVYLLHGFFIQYFRQIDAFKVDGILDVFGLAVLSMLIVLLLSSKPALTLAQPFIEGKFAFLRKRQQTS
ncbi:acyltransferase family protein [Thalassobacillus devorans]|uniref:acyltransferase family protein n=1 Tax=Thalassobacillus devorans TaxID=279813 RepID=UPI000A1CB81D|nr:acyltransferase family protein [Thalassobacillus devorans]